jgi:dTDP-4-dehydrorhamnose 3,5-epimerase-like enzyme
MNVKNCHIITLPVFPDGDDGKLTFAEGLRTIPFEIKRVYYIYDLEKPDAIRGKHAHKELEQAIFCVNGSYTIGLDDGHNKEELFIDKPNKGVYLGTGLWHTMTNFSKDCVLLVMASDYYYESDYIRDYDQFLKFINSK